MQAVNKLSSLHCNHHARSIVNRSCTEVPGIEVPRNYDDLFRMLRSFQVRDHVVSLGFRALAGRKRQMETHRALNSESRDQAGIFGGDSGFGSRRVSI